MVYSLEMQEKLSQELELWVKAYDEAYALNRKSNALYLRRANKSIQPFQYVSIAAIQLKCMFLNDDLNWLT